MEILQICEYGISLGPSPTTKNENEKLFHPYRKKWIDNLINKMKSLHFT